MKKIKTFLGLLVCLIFIAGSLYAQQGVTITGKVTDSSTGESLPGVSIVVKGTNRGTSTSIDGNYSINASVGDVLSYSFVGYETKEITVGNETTVNVSLTQAVTSLQQVVVIGYGTVKKSDATGSVSVVSTKDFNKGAISSPQNLITGKVAGVVITSSGGAPGSSSTIRIRGGSSMSASNDPLIVIDGVPIDNSNVSGSPNALTAVNPNDIESVTVLKDASATAIYGSRASNGVILITTKKGTKKFSVSYQGNFSAITLPNKVDVLNGDQYRKVVQEQVDRGFLSQDAADLLGTANTNWQNEIYRTAFAHDHNLSLSGTALTTPYRLSLGFTDEQGTLKTTDFKRGTVSVNLNPSFFDDHLKVNVNVKGMSNQNNFGNTGAIGAAVSYDPTRPVFNDNTRWRGYTTWTTNPDSVNSDALPLATANPVAQLDLTDNTSNVMRSIGNVQLDYMFHFLPDLHANLNLGYDYSKSEGHNNVAEGTGWTYNSAYSGGRLENYSQTRKNELLDFYLNYDKDIDAIQSNINVMGGYSWTHYYSENQDSTYNAAQDYRISISPARTRYYLVSFFGRLNYSLMDKYLLTFTVRDDGTSRFSSDNRWGLFPSAAFAWKIKNESFLQNVKALSQLKLRLGYGVTGQQNLNIGTNFPYLPVFRIANPTIEYQLGDNFYRTLRPDGYNKDLKWETTTTYNAGLDFGFLENRFTGSVEYYYRQTKDLINSINVAAGTNLTNVIVANVGDLENRGVEFSFEGRLISKPNFSWDINYNLAYNKNKITKLTLTDDPNYFVLTGNISGGTGNNIQVQKVDNPTFSYYVYKQIYGQNDKPLQGVYLDRNNDGIINSSDLYTYKNPAPDVTMGIASTFTYKNLDLSFSGRVNLGNYVYNNIASGSSYLNLYTGGFMSNIVSSATNTAFTQPQYQSDYYIENGSFFRMDNITLGYTIPDVIQDQMNVRLSAMVRNAFVITNYSGLDPEVNGGIDNNFYPRSRTFLLGVNIDF